MKKLLFILSAIFVSVMGWGAELVSADSNEGLGIPYTLNPYAYDLNSTWDEVSQQLTVHFKLNSPPNLNDGTGDGNYNTQHLEPNGLQIFAVDPEGNKYRIGGPGRATIQANHKKEGGQYGQYDLLIELADGVNAVGNEQSTRLDIPRGVPLTWEVWVKGRSETETYTVPRLVNATVDKQPYKMAGVAIGTNPYAENFAKTFIANTDNGGGLQGNATYGWLYTALQGKVEGHATADRTPALLEYTANLKYAARHRKGEHDDDKTSWFSSHSFSEPHRVRVSEDGRVFVSSYLNNVTENVWAIAEYLGDDKFRTIIETDYDVNKDQSGTTYAPGPKNKYLRRVVDFDVKGSGQDLKILAAWVDPRARLENSAYWYAKVECYEYELGKAESDGVILPLGQANGTLVAEYNDYNPESNKHGLIFQGYAGAPTKRDGANYYESEDMYTAGREGFIGVAYGKGENNPIWMKVDFGINTQFPAHILYYDAIGNQRSTAKKDLTIPKGYSSTGFYGGHALVVTEDYLITADGRTQPTTDHNKHLLFYSLNDLSSRTTGDLPNRTHAVMVTKEQNAAYINGLALDYANNLYIVSAGTNKVYTFGLPYSGVVKTPAPLKASNTFMLPHLASGLEYHPYYDDVTKKGDKYKFSFNVDVANPTAVEICFYDTKDKMLKGGDNYSFRYSFPAGDCKEGEMSVVLDAVGGTIQGDKSLNNPDSEENAYLNLPRGEYYWNVRVSRNVTIGSENHTQVDATPASDSYCFVPERITQDEDNGYIIKQYLEGGVFAGQSCTMVDIFRPLKKDYFGTFCLPFDLDLTQLTDGHPYKVLNNGEGATLLEFSGVELKTINDENVLELQFIKANKVGAGIPYLFKPKYDINTMVSLAYSDPANEIQFKATEGSTVTRYFSNDENNVTFYGMISVRDVYSTNPEETILILVDQNRLAKVTERGNILGFRGVFVLAHELPAGTQVGIAERKPTPTSIIDLNGTQVDVEKFMREGRVYIRVGESLYTLSGEKVE